MTSIGLALSLLLGSPLLSLQQEGWAETTFHRIFLRNGNFIDGRVISDKPGEVVLLMRAGEMAIRRDQIDRVELMKLKTWNEKPIILQTPKATVKPKETDPKSPATPIVDTPEGIRKRVDMIMFKFKNSPASGEDREIPVQDIAALGEEATVYLASRLPVYDEKSQEAIGMCLIRLNKIKASDKVNAVLEVELGHDNPAVRALAVTILGAISDDEGKLKYLRTPLQDRDAKVRLAAISGAGSAVSRDWFDPIKDLCGDANGDVRNRALRILKNLADKYGLKENLAQTLISQMHNPDPGVRADSAGALGALGDKAYWRGLVDALNDQEVPVRAAAAQGLMVLGVPESGEDILGSLTREKERSVLVFLIGATEKIRIQKAIEPLIRLLGESDEEIKRLAYGSLRSLTGQTLDPDVTAWTDWWTKNRPK